MSLDPNLPVPVAVFLAFAGWTVALLLFTVGIYRWSRILTGRAALVDFPADRPEGTALYRRAMRAHANCVENLPVYGAVALAVAVTGAASPVLDTLALVFLGARVAQSSVHVALPETNASVAVRFGFFLTQLVCVVAMGVRLAFA